MISFVAHKETINLAMQNGINLVALLLCDNNLIKRAVSARHKILPQAAQDNLLNSTNLKIPQYKRI